MLTQFVSQNIKDLKNIATAVRTLSMDAVLKAKSGHVGLPLGGAEMGTLLYFAIMNHTAENPTWIDRDRFVLSAGHGSVLQYALLHLTGYAVSLSDLSNFRQLNSKTPGHPEFGHTEGVECTTGPLGQGISNAVGMAIAERMLESRFQDKDFQVIDHRTYVLAGDGCLMEGVSSESCSLAGHLKLNRLIVLYDSNNITIDGTTEIAFTENVGKRFEAYGWNVLHADGNDFISLAEAMDKAHQFSQQPNGATGPSIVICKSIAGKGSPKWEGKPKIHGNPMSLEDVSAAKKNLGILNEEPFFIPEEFIKSAKKLSEKRAKKYKTWTHKYEDIKAKWESNDLEKYKLWKLCFEKPAPSLLDSKAIAKAKGKSATRSSGSQALLELAKQNPNLVGGSADLASSNLTTLSNSTFISATDFSGRNIHFGVREHGMAAICNGIILHGGLRTYCATFAVFSDYMRPAIRLAALMKTPTIFIFTHDSFAVGEDGPTHQPVEQAASLRAIPNLNVLRPADTLETFAAWEFALAQTNSPSALLLTRQEVEDLDSLLQKDEREYSEIVNAMKYGAYLLKDFSQPVVPLKIAIVASGSEVAIALKTAYKLENKLLQNAQGAKTHISVRVVSAPAPQSLVENPLLFNSLLPKEIPIFAIEAGVAQSWGEIVGRNGAIFSMKGFGASASANDLAAHFGFTDNAFFNFVINQLGLR